MPATSWIAHVKQVHKKQGGSFKDALKAASKTWKKGGAAAAPKKKRRGKKAAAEEPAEEVDDVEEDEKAPPKRRRKRKTKKKPVERSVPVAATRGNRPGPPKHYKNIN